MEVLTPEAAVARRVARLQDTKGLSNEELGRRMAALGFPNVGRHAVRDIKAGKRKVSLNEALALAWALEIAPVHLIVPFEAEEEVTPDADAEDVPPSDPPAACLAVGDRLLMLPIEARSWIAGRSVRHDDDHDVDRRRERSFYVENVPPDEREQHLAASREVTARIQDVEHVLTLAQRAGRDLTDAELQTLARHTVGPVSGETAPLDEEP
jgi:hypothetical protein